MEKAQELALKRQGKLANLVEEKRAAICALHLSEHARVGTGVRAALVTKELALYKRGGKIGAVHVDERALAAWAVDVNCPGKKALAGAGLAAQEHCDVSSRGLQNISVHRVHGLGGADHVIEGAAERNAVFVACAAQSGVGKGAADLICQGGEERLVAVAKCATGLVQNLYDSQEVGVAIANRGAQHGARLVAGLAIGLWGKAAIAAGIFNVHQRAGLRDVPHNALASGDTQFVELGKVCNPGAQDSGLRVGKP